METKLWGYCDLSLYRNFDKDKFQNIHNLGFGTIAINTYVEETSDEPKKKKKKGEMKEKKDFVPPPSENKDVQSCQLNILHRVTIEFSDSSIAHKMNQSENLKKYDIIAVVPKTLQAFQYACGTMDVDVITFAPEARIPFKVSRKSYRQAVDRGLFFELMYSPAIKDSTARKNIISTAHTYHAVGKSKNIILSSGADNYSHIRGIYDVFNLGFILGLNSTQSLEVLKDNPRRLILKAEGRRCGKLYMKIVSIDNDGENDNKMVEE